MSHGWPDYEAFEVPVTVLQGGTGLGSVDRGKLLTGRAASALGMVGGIRCASAFAGADWGAKINAAIADLPATGGTVWIDLEGSASFSTQIVILKPIVLRGMGKRNTLLNFTDPSAYALVVNVPNASVKEGHATLRDFSLAGPGKAAGSTFGITLVDGISTRLLNLKISDFAGDAIQITGDGASGRFTHFVHGDGITIDSCGGAGLYLTGTDSNVCRFTNLDIRSCGWGIYLHHYGVHPAYNYFQGHVSYNTINIYVESRGNRFDVYLEGSVLTTWHMDLTADSGYNSIRVFPSWDTTKIRDYGVQNEVTRASSLVSAFPTDPPAGSAPATLIVQNKLAAIAADTDAFPVGISGQVLIRADNTKNWTNAAGPSPIYGVLATEVGATGIVTAAAVFRAYISHLAGTITDLYQFFAPAKVGAGAVTRMHSFHAEAGAGAGEFYDGVRIGSNTYIFTGAATTRAGVRAQVGETPGVGSLYLGTAAHSYIKVASAGADTDWERITTTASD